jgi:hypothetical protein
VKANPADGAQNRSDDPGLQRPFVIFPPGKISILKIVEKDKPKL